MPIARLLAVVFALFAAAHALAAADALKDEAVSRLIASHDLAIPIAVGRVYVKQAGLQAARAFLTEQGRAAGLGSQWNAGAPEWQAAEHALTRALDGIIASRIDDPAWLRLAWSQAAAQVLNAEEADEIAGHFASDGGKQQRAVVELLLVGETLLANYTFTDRIRYGVKGSEREMEQLQRAWWVTDHKKIYDFSPYPNAIRFATQDPGVKYCKMLAIQGIEVINRHYEAIAREAVQTIRSERSAIEPYLTQFRKRVAQ